jgi:putative ABC transport system substrate-binding protein
MVTWQAFARIVAVALGILLALSTARAQPSQRVYRVGLLSYGPYESSNYWAAFRQQMQELGYVEAQNVRYEVRWGNADTERIAKVADELVQLKVDVIVTSATNAAIAAKRATSTIPIVTASGSDPVELGLVASFRQPGGNVTGMTSIASEPSGKRLDVVRQVVPQASRVAIVWDGQNPASRLTAQETEAAAAASRLTLRSVPVKSAADLDAAFSNLSADRPAGVIITTSQLLSAHRARVAALALKHRLPTVGGDRTWVDAGILAAYGADYASLARGAAIFTRTPTPGFARGASSFKDDQGHTLYFGESRRQ